jgi:hypothetical protein
MTPELKEACELAFQEHKSGHPINWDKDVFRGRISFGLSAMAKQTLERRNIISTLNPAKKTITVLNPAAVTATTFEEAEEMLLNKPQVVIATTTDDKPSYISHNSSSFASPITNYTDRLVHSAAKSVTVTGEIKWYMKPLFYYIAWPVCAAVVGGFIAWFLATLVS